MEKWIDITGFKGFYQVSNKGRVKRLATSFECGSRWGKKRKISFKEKILSPCSFSNGYLVVSLCTQKTKVRPMLHRLVAIHFLPNPLKLPQVNHLDGDKKNNSVENLMWVSQSENMLHSFHVLKNQSVNNKKVIDKETGKVFFSVRQAAIFHGIKYPTLYAYLTNKLKNKTNLTFYVTD